MPVIAHAEDWGWHRGRGTAIGQEGGPFPGRLIGAERFVMNVVGHSDKERVLGATDLVSLIGEFVQLRRKGREHVGLCPFHDDHSPSMHIVSHKGEPFYKCFSCGAGGNAVDFVINYHKMSFIDALRHLADRAGIELTQRGQQAGAPESAEGGPRRGDLLEANAFAQQFFQRVLKHEQAGAAARHVIAARGISDDMVLRFGLGAAPNDWEGLVNLVRKRGLDPRAFRDAGLVKERSGGAAHGVRDTFVNRLTFAITDQLGRPIAFGGRVLNADDQPKYLNSPESRLFEKGKTLYALHQAQKAIRDQGLAIVAEGYIDVIALHQHGFTNAVATLGTALTREHARTLQRVCNTVVLLFDGDEAGQNAADRAIEIFFSEPIDVKICVLPGGIDPDDLLRRDDGANQLRSLIESAESALSFLVRRFRADLAQHEGISARQQRIEALLARLADLGLGAMSGLRKRLVLPALAHELNMSAEDLERLIPRRRLRAAAEVKPSGSINPTALSEPSSSVRIDVDGNPILRQRLVAEENLLAIVLFEPSTVFTPIDAGDGHLLPLAEAYLPEAFLDSACRAVYTIVHDMAESGEEISVPAVQQRLSDNQHRALVATLFFRGSELCADDDSHAPAALAAAAAGFDRVRDRDQLHARVRVLRTPAQVGSLPRPPSLLGIIEERRRHGDDLLAAPRRARQT